MYILSIYRLSVTHYSIYPNTDGDESGVSIGDILQFISGSRRLPAAGFPCIPSVHFTNEKILPKTSTCDVSITFPRSFDELPYEMFKKKMDMSVLDSAGFGGGP